MVGLLSVRCLLYVRAWSRTTMKIGAYFEKNFYWRSDFFKVTISSFHKTKAQNQVINTSIKSAISPIVGRKMWIKWKSRQCTDELCVKSNHHFNNASLSKNLSTQFKALTNSGVVIHIRKHVNKSILTVLPLFFVEKSISLYFWCNLIVEMF